MYLAEQNLGRSGICGVCVYVCDIIHASEVSFLEHKVTESIWLHIKLRGRDKLTVGCIYRSPIVDSHLSVDEIVSLLQTVHAEAPSHLMTAGDFNLPQIDWSTYCCHASDTHHAHKFLDVVQECFLCQHVQQPTRYREGKHPSLLDLILTNEEGMLTDLRHLPGIGKSDHEVLSSQLACYNNKKVTNLGKHNIHRANFEKMNRMFAEKCWYQLLTGDVDEAYRFFKDTVDKTISACIPVTKSNRGRKNIYMNSSALQLKKL